MRGLLLVIGAMCALLVAYVMYLANDAGEFRTLADQHPDQCRRITGMPGSEDITLHPESRFAYISSDDRRGVINGNPTPGAIFRYDLSSASTTPLNLTPNADLQFRPHGISLFVGDDGRETLFVVNHPGESLFGAPEGENNEALHTIEVFDVVDNALMHRQTHASEWLISPNDVVGVDHDRFYVTNDHGAGPGLMRQLEDYLRLPWANVVYFDGDVFKEVGDGLSFANGINMSPDGTQLYVAEVSRNLVRIYQRNPGSGSLSLQQTIDVGFGADNIEIDPATGDLWIGGHPRLLTFLRHAADGSVDSPSQVVRIRQVGAGYQITTEYMDSGELISGASVGASDGRRLLIGSVFEDHIMDCSL
ncbi:strictosidine synthase family protein [Pseudohongiella acticola]|jgi:arylesterase / paraoxonase|uniref:strictosidine synthase family protein n=1 Tax=Pseudohongiella acticola TaxID=1524254 RepID=UPI0030ED4B89